MNNYIVIDIETAPLSREEVLGRSKEYKEYVPLPPFNAGSVNVTRLKPETAQAKIAQAMTDYPAVCEAHELEYYAKKSAFEGELVAKAALDPYKGWICGLGIKGLINKEEIDIILTAKHQANENILLATFWDIIEENGSILVDVVGHNIRDFDMPFIMARSMIMNVPVPPTALSQYRGSVSLSDRFKDTMLWAKFGSRNVNVSLDKLSKSLGLEGKNGNGAMFYETLLEDKDKAEAYLKNDVELTHECAKRLGMI